MGERTDPLITPFCCLDLLNAGCMLSVMVPFKVILPFLAVDEYTGFFKTNIHKEKIRRG